MTYDPISPADLTAPEVKREAHSLHTLISDVTDKDVHDDTAITLALAVAYAEQCELLQIDPVDALLQIIDAYPALDIAA